MAEETGISWADATWSPWHGCTKVSPACDGCYAENLMANRFRTVEWGPHGERKRSADWGKPRRWDRIAGRDGTRPFVFPSLCDPFDNQAPPEWRREWFELIRDTPNLVWLLLTKRPQNIVRMVKEVGFMPRNIAFGTTCEDRQRVKTNLPHLFVAAALRPLFLFMSAEPLLGDLGDLSPWLQGDPRTAELGPGEEWYPASQGGFKRGADGWPKLPALGWIITGGETDQGGHKARPPHPDWIRSLRDQAARFGTPFHHKQWGSWSPIAGPEEGNEVFTFSDGTSLRKAGPRRAGRSLDGIVHQDIPEVR